MAPPTLLHNARVLGQAQANALLLRDGRIEAVGHASMLRAAGAVETETIDCGGRLVTPGLHDAHAHLFALASELHAVDCGPAFAGSFAELQARLAGAAAHVPEGGWLVGHSYDPWILAERCDPDRHTLDSIRAPVVLHQRSRHLCVLNTAALRALGVWGAGTVPAEGLVEKDQEGVPTGRLFELSGWVSSLLPQPGVAENAAGLRQVLSDFLAYGVTAVQDASPGNGLKRWDLLQTLTRKGDLPRITMMLGARNLEGAGDAGLRFGAGDGRLRLGHLKIMTHETTGWLRPDVAELSATVARAHRVGFPVAIHTIGSEPLRAALDVLAADRPPAGKDRLEHVSVCAPADQARIAALRLGVAGQPNFIYASGDRYLSEVPAPELPWLYPTGMLLRRGVPVAAASDAPVAPIDPRLGLFSSVNRRTRSGARLGERHAVTRRQALTMHTFTPARLSPWAGRLGRLSPDYAADLVIWNDNLLTIPDIALLQARPFIVMLGGQIVFRDGT